MSRYNRGNLKLASEPGYLLGTRDPKSICNHEQRDLGVVLAGKVQLEEQGAHTNKTGNREDRQGRRGFLLDVDFSLGEVVGERQDLYIL